MRGQSIFSITLVVFASSVLAAPLAVEEVIEVREALTFGKIGVVNAGVDFNIKRNDIQ